MKNKTGMALLLAISMVILPVQYVHAENSIDYEGVRIEDGHAESNIESENIVESEFIGGYKKSELDYNTPIFSSNYSVYTSVPSSYPENMDNFYKMYPTTRNQNPYGTCWAFASIGLAEFDLINDSMRGHGNFDQNIDLSELQLAYFTYNSVNDPLGGTEGDYTKYYNENGSVSYLDYGGNYEMAARRLTQWCGPVKEEMIPYSMASSTLENGLDDSYAYEYDEAHLENVYMINIKSNFMDVKNQIMEHGAVGVMYYHNNNSFGWNSSLMQYTYHDSSVSGGGHAVMIVGWDDSFSKDNFTGNTKPSSDGAWLVRNSWGLYANYFWMSYETASLADTAWVFDFSGEDELDNNYQLDGGVLVYPDTSHKILANVFRTKQTEKDSEEILKAVSLSFSKAANVEYTIEIYTDLTNENDPLSGTRQEAAITTGETAYAGIYTIPLENYVTLKSGTTFSVIVKVNSAVLDYEQAQSVATDDFSKMIWDCGISLGNNKSFYYSGNKFYPFYWGNYCVKALTANVGNTYHISYELDGGINNIDNPDSYVERNPEIVLSDPTKEGYIFSGWYVDPEFTERITAIPENSSLDYILYAKWSKYLDDVRLNCRGHVQDYGWIENVEAGDVIGTTGESLRLEAFKLSIFSEKDLGIQYSSWVSGEGWQDEKENGEISGTVGYSKPIEAIKINLTGEDSGLYDIFYRVHVQDYGWLSWTKDGKIAGTLGYDKRLEAVQVAIFPKGEAPDDSYNNILSANENSYIQRKLYELQYQVHIQDYGWLPTKTEGIVAGTVGENRRLEAICLDLKDKEYSGDIIYTTHVQQYGWLNDLNNRTLWKKNGEISGTVGESMRCEAICIALTGEMQMHFDIYYRVHVQQYGWLGWTSNGAPAGTSGYSYRMEAIQIVLVPKGSGTPETDYKGIISITDKAYLY